jgi:hypothetical protein
MLSATRILFGCLLLSWWGIVGCVPSGTTTVDEEKEPNFLEGKSRVAAMDFRGAIESYERSLEVNPRSAAAHFELGWLCDQKDNDPAAAIYHYSAYLKLHGEGTKADRARTWIAACKQELVKNVSLVPVSQSLQRENEKLAEENRQLKVEVEQWRAHYNETKANTSPNAVGKAPPGLTTELVRSSSPASGAPARAATSSDKTEPASAAPKTHVIKSGETPAGIARVYGVKVDALMRANPGADARRLRIGQSLVIPLP